MKQKNLWIAALALGITLSAHGQQSGGGISPTMLQQIKQSYQGTPADKAIRNAITNNDINKLAVNGESKNNLDTYFSNKVESKGISNQRSSGRCWLFTGLNVFRAQAIAKYDMGDFQFSQNYSLETNSSNSTGRMSNLIGLKLKEYGLQLRDLSTTKGTTVADLEKKKTEMLGTIYRMLVLNLGEPPTKFTWTRKDAKGNPVETKEYTPQSFFQEYIGDDLKNNYVMLMNDPSRDYYKLYEIDYDRHAYDGKNWTYVNLPIEDIKQMAIASIKDSTMMYFSCDVGKFFDRDRGILDVNFYDYGSLMGTTFGMDKKQRIQTFASGSSHAMTLMAVDLDANGKPKKWMVENSWGPGANAGHLIMTDQWFNEYMFRLVVNKKYITDQVKEILKQTPTRLPAWDPMFAEED